MVCAVAVFAADADSTQLPAKRPRVGLVLSGGGAKGIAHVGALKVIEELGIPVDYIGGTSMGSIVGGLYALGYTSMQLEAYMKGIDWENLLGDGVRRLHVGIYEKGERRRYWLQIPLRGRKLELPMGILSGQNVSNLLTELASPAYAEEDFGKFPIPFLCVATDIKTGNGVVLERGDLARSMRASMAIPSVFTPEMIDGRQLFDGGLVDNFPVDLVREKGVDIIIGVDVGSSVGEKSVSNIAQVMEQVVFMSSQARRISGAEQCDVLIIPSISEYGASNFNAADSLIARGERAARQHVDRLRALADSLRGFAPDAPVEAHAICPQPLHSFFVREVEINGLEHSTREFFLQKLELNFPAVWTFADLNRAMDKLRGSQVFQTVTYQLHPLDTPGEVEIRFDCTEQSAGVFRGGVHYDPEYKAALLLNLSQRNILLQNSRASAELSIGTNPFFALSFLHTPRMQFRKKETAQYLSPDWQFYVSGYQHGAYNYDGNRRVEEYTFAVVSTGMELLVSPTINSAAGVGITGDYSLTKTWEGSEQANNREDHQFWMRYRLFFERDTYNEDYFPTSGARIHLEAMYHHSSIVGPYQGDGFAGVMFRSGFASSPTDRWTILTGIDAGVSFGANIPHQYRMRLGGIPDRLLNRHVPFAGMYFMQRHNEHLWAAHFNNQARLWNNIFLTLRTHIAKAEDDMKELVTWRNFLIGGGISLQYNSVVGPFGFTLSSSNVTRSVLGAFHLGFWF